MKWHKTAWNSYRFHAAAMLQAFLALNAVGGYELVDPSAYDKSYTAQKSCPGVGLDVGWKMRLNQGVVEMTLTSRTLY